MANITPVIPSNTVSLGSPLITPRWPLAAVPASDPLAGGDAPQMPDPINDPDTAALFQIALVQSGHTSDKLV